MRETSATRKTGKELSNKGRTVSKIEFLKYMLKNSKIIFSKELNMLPKSETNVQQYTREDQYELHLPLLHSVNALL